jgi:ribulose-phosphate 3-epimerase
MKEIIPAILPKNFEDLKSKIGQMRGLVPIVQVDLCDGIFVPTITWPFRDQDARSVDEILNEREGMPYWDEINFEFDLMVSDAVENLEKYIKLGARRLVFHMEAVGDAQEFREFIEGMDMYVKENLDIGVALNNDTDLEIIESFIHDIDFVQLMGIKEIGKQGEPFDERVLERIEQLKAKHPDIVISIDGAVNEDTAERLLAAGADRLVIGSAIWESDDIVGALSYFKELANQ